MTARSDRSERAVEIMAAGGSCAQAVLGVFCEETGLAREIAMKLAGGFGAGMGRRQEVCGAVTGGIMAIGLKHGPESPGEREAKERAYLLTRELMSRFEAECGSCLCRELLKECDLATAAGQRKYNEDGLSEKVCRPCVRTAVRILEKIL